MTKLDNYGITGTFIEANVLQKQTNEKTKQSQINKIPDKYIYCNSQ